MMIAAQQKEQFIDRMLQSLAGAFDILSVFLGDELGLYTALRTGDWFTSTELAQRTQAHERYIREWLEQQTVTGILEVEDEAQPSLARRYRLPEGHREVLTDTDSLDYLAPLVQVLAGITQPLPELLNAYRQGGGVPYSKYHQFMMPGQARMNRAMFLQQLGQEWLPALPDLHERLQSIPDAHIADIGCGGGWSSIALAKTYPQAHIHAYDLDEASVELARQNITSAGLSDRIQVYCQDAAEVGGQYDLVTAFECIHDMGNPVAALKTMRQLLRGQGTVLIADERVGDRFTARGDDVEWMMYGWSILHCLPVGMADGGECFCGGTGTVMRPDTLRLYAQGAGFKSMDILPIDHFFFRFYRLNA